MTSVRDGATDLYRFFDANDRLLYVGISFSAVARASQHRSEKDWWSDVARMDVEHLPSRAAAEQAERDAIRAESPLHNVVHNQSAGYTSTRSLTSSGPPFSAGAVFAFGLDDGTCPVGYISRSWAADNVYTRPTIEVKLYHWLSGEFGFREVVIDATTIRKALKADYEIDGQTKVFQMDPLGDFQTAWQSAA